VAGRGGGRDRSGLRAPFASGQTTLFVQTDTTWKVTNSSPGTGWNTSAGFDDSAWAAASINGSDSLAGLTVPEIWDNTDPQAGSTDVWFRKTFTLDGPHAGRATLFSAVDDDADVYVNGTQVINNHDCTASALPIVDVASYLVSGTNLIAVHGIDCGGNQMFELLLEGPQPIPALDYCGFLALAGILAAVGILVIRRSAA